MKTKYILLILFLVAAGAQLYVPTSMILSQEDILTAGKTFKFRTAPVDPNDPLRGKYVALRYQDNSLTIPDSVYFYRNQKIFVEIEEDYEGFAIIKDISQAPPLQGSDYFDANLQSVSYYDDSTRLWIIYPFNRFYMEEHKAPEAEKLYNESTWNTDVPTWAVVKIKDGKAALQDVRLDGRSLTDIVNEQLEK